MMGLPDLGGWETAREADQAGGPVRLRRDHDQVSLGKTIGAFFTEAQWAQFTAAGYRKLAEGQAWQQEQGLHDEAGPDAAAAASAQRDLAWSLIGGYQGTGQPEDLDVSP